MSLLDILAQAASHDPAPQMDPAPDDLGSNIASLPDDVRLYLELTQRKQGLLDQIHDIQQKLKPLQAPMIHRMLEDSQKSFQICPSRDEEVKYGPIGALQIKVRNDFESLTRDNLVRLMTEFYKYILEGSNPDEIARLGQGTAVWLWDNRNRVPVRYLDRTCVVRPEKRKAPAPADTAASTSAAKKPAPGDKIPRAPKFKPVANMPHTREEFLGIPAMQTMIQTGSAPIPGQDVIGSESDRDDPDTDE